VQSQQAKSRQLGPECGHRLIRRFEQGPRGRADLVLSQEIGNGLREGAMVLGDGE
jgi:hypothetical protein